MSGEQVVNSEVTENSSRSLENFLVNLRFFRDLRDLEVFPLTHRALVQCDKG